MAWIDADEFIFPQNNKSIPEVVDEILADRKNAAGVAVNIHNFGSNFQETADYSRGVLERFTMRAEDKIVDITAEKNSAILTNLNVKTIANPRRVDYFWSPHFAEYFFGTNAINECGEVVERNFNNPPTVNKIVMNHYPNKSREEYEKKVLRGAADFIYNIYEKRPFSHVYNDVFDDGIIKYRDSREKNILESSADMQERIFHALEENLLSANPENLSKVLQR